MSLYKNDRRTGRRHRTQLAIRVLVLVTKRTDDDGESVLTCIGYTHNISESGLAVIISGRSINESFLNKKDCTMQVGLTLPTGSVDITAIPVRFERVADGKTESGEEVPTEQGFLVGMLITEMPDDARARYIEYLREVVTS
ncbi:MAG TPA: hypothetical protein VGX92_01415 [Pyrinomonadaceae bacterium]|nr:hypothetical protein [Pyrinomonadaceae bacterium]